MIWISINTPRNVKAIVNNNIIPSDMIFLFKFLRSKPITLTIETLEFNIYFRSKVKVGFSCTHCLVFPFVCV
jgi:hypothetical protein